MTATATTQTPPLTGPFAPAALGADGDWVQEALDGALGRGWSTAATLGQDRRGLRDALLSATAGGKRLRPRLVAAVHHALGGTATEALSHVAAAVELLHTAFVVHDDVIDRDETR